jgi:hypothetical protein
LVLEREGNAATRVRSVEFDPSHLRLVIHEEELPLARSRDVAIASKYTEDEEESEEEEEEEEEEDKEMGERAKSEKRNEVNMTRAQVDREIIRTLERALSLDAVANENRFNTSLAGKAPVSEEVEDGPAAIAESDSETGAEAEGEGNEGGMAESSIQEFVLVDPEPAVKLQRLCASLGVPWLIDGSQVCQYVAVYGVWVLLLRASCVLRAVRV